MQNNDKLEKLDNLTLETEILTRVLADAMEKYEEIDGISELNFLLTIISIFYQAIRAEIRF